MDKRVKKYIEDSWLVIGRTFDVKDVPVCQYESTDLDDIGFISKNKPLRSWILKNGAIEDAPLTNIERVPYIAFTFEEETRRMLIDIQWEYLGGRGWDIVFSQNGEILSKSMRWIS